MDKKGKMAELFGPGHFVALALALALALRLKSEIRTRDLRNRDFPTP
jgi:hypothetical protein